MRSNQTGYTLVELLVTMTVLGILVLGSANLFTSLLHSAIVSQRQAVASALATNQMEYIKSLPYDNLAVAGGAIISNNTIPASFTKTVQGMKYTITNSITYADDAYDGCGSYPTQQIKEQYCLHYPPPIGSPGTDTNAGDYKDVRVTVKDRNNTQLAALDTNIGAHVAETSSNTGALFVKVIDDSGAPISGAIVNVTNAYTVPAVNATETTDSNGIVILYNLPPSTTNYRYQITASKNGYSSLATIVPNGSLQPTYPSQNLIVQSSSFVTLTIKPMTANSLIIESTDTNSTALANVRVYAKGGYKKYTDAVDTCYYFDNYFDNTNTCGISISDNRPTTDGNGIATITNLVPGSYVFCGEDGDLNCKIGSTTYFLAAAVPYGGNSSLQPINVPIYDPSSPPATTFDIGGSNYLQKVRLMLTTNSTFPRVRGLTPSDLSIAAGNLASFAFIVNGHNLPCDSNPAACSTVVKFTQGANIFTASCTGDIAGKLLNCTADLSAITQGVAQMSVTVGSNTLTLPTTPLLGGLVAKP